MKKVPTKRAKLTNQTKITTPGATDPSVDISWTVSTGDGPGDKLNTPDGANEGRADTGELGQTRPASSLGSDPPTIRCGQSTTTGSH